MSTEHGRAETEEERTTEVVLGSTLVFQSFKILTSVSSFNRTRVLKLQDYLAIKCYYSSFFLERIAYIADPRSFMAILFLIMNRNISERNCGR